MALVVVKQELETSCHKQCILANVGANCSKISPQQNGYTDNVYEYIDTIGVIRAIERQLRVYE